MSRILVTGGAGFIGSHIAQWYIDNGHEVAVADDLSGGYRDNVPKEAMFVQVDLSNKYDVAVLFEEFQPEYVFHLAAYAAEGLSHFIRQFNYTNNLMASINLINESIKAGVKCFGFTSSMGVYGTQQIPYREDQTPMPEDPYGIAKFSIEQDLKTAKEMFGMDYVIIRPHNVYGEHQNTGDKYRNVIGIFMNQILSNKPITIFGDGEQVRAFSYIGDIAPVMAKCLLNPKTYSQIFNMGGDKPYTINEMAQSVIKAMGAEDTEIKHLAERYEVKHAYANHDAIRQYYELPQTPFEEGLQNMADWVKKVGARSTTLMPIEIDKNLYEAWQ